MRKDIPEPDGPESIVYQGKVIEVVRQPMRIGETKTTFEFARRSPGTRLIIHDANESKLLITKEYRPELKGWDYRLPGGKVFDSLTEYNDFAKSGKDIVEQAKQAAAKEAREEVGLDVENLQLFTASHAGLTIQWDLYYFVIETFQKNPEGQQLEHGENVEPMWMKIEGVKELCFSGEISEDRTVGVLLRYLHTLDAK